MSQGLRPTLQASVARAHAAEAGTTFICLRNACHSPSTRLQGPPTHRANYDNQPNRGQATHHKLQADALPPHLPAQLRARAIKHLRTFTVDTNTPPHNTKARTHSHTQSSLCVRAHAYACACACVWCATASAIVHANDERNVTPESDTST